MDQREMQDDPLRALWIPVRLLFLACSGAAILIAAALARSHAAGSAVAGVAAAAAALGAAVWDTVLLVRRKRRVKAGLEEFSVFDPLDLWYPVAIFGSFPLIVAVVPATPSAARWAIVTLSAMVLVCSPAGPRVLSVVPKR